MESQLLPDVLTMLREEFLLEDHEFEASQNSVLVNMEENLKVEIRVFREDACLWVETFGRDGERIFGHVKHTGYDTNDKNVALGFVRDQCLHRYSLVWKSVVEKHKNILKEKERLLAEIERLRQKKRER
nr:hypothetical protein [Marseillevirus cajuinensis]